MTTSTKSKSPKFTEDEAYALFERAHSAGMLAGDKARPTPMTVVVRENPFDDNSPIVKRYAPVMDGVCGFGWVNVRPGNSSFANWLRKTNRGRNAYHGGVDIWVREFNQSYERKIAYARAFAGVLTEAGITAYGTGRLD